MALIDYTDFSNLHTPIFTILIPFFIIQVCWAGGLFIFASISPGERAKAKDMLWKSIVSMVLVTVSPLLFTILVGWADELCGEIIGIFKEEMTNPAAMMGHLVTNSTVKVKEQFNPGSPFLQTLGILFAGIATYVALAAAAANIIILGIFITLLIGPLALLAVRMILLIFFYIIFPATIFMHFFPPTRKLGGKLLGQTIVWILVKPLIVLIFVVTLTVALTLSKGSPDQFQAGVPPQWTVGDEIVSALIQILAPPFIIAAGLVLTTMMPLLMTSTLKWAGAPIAAAGMAGLVRQGRTDTQKLTSFSAVALGGAMMGSGSTSITQAATQAAWMGGGINVGEGAGFFSPSTFKSLGEKGWGSVRHPIKSAKASAKAAWGSKGEGSFLNRLQNRARDSNLFGTEGALPLFDKKGRAEAVREAWGAPPASGAASGGVGVGGGGVPSSGTQGGMAGIDKGVDKSVKSPASGRPANEPYGGYSDSIGTQLSAEQELTSRETQGYLGFYPLVNFWDRVQDVSSVGELNWQARALRRAGDTVGARKLEMRGVGLVLGAAVPAFFFPVRHMGRILFNVAPVFIPAPFQPAAYAVGKTMAGLSVGQFASRRAYSHRARRYERQYNRAIDAERAAVNELDSLQKSGKTGDDLVAARKKVDAARERVGEVVRKNNEMLDELRHTGSSLRGTTDVNHHRKLVEWLEKKNPHLYMAYKEGSRRHIDAKELELPSALEAYEKAQKKYGASGDKKDLEACQKQAQHLITIANTLERTAGLDSGVAEGIKAKAKAGESMGDSNNHSDVAGKMQSKWNGEIKKRTSAALLQEVAKTRVAREHSADTVAEQKEFIESHTELKAEFNSTGGVLDATEVGGGGKVVGRTVAVNRNFLPQGAELDAVDQNATVISKDVLRALREKYPETAENQLRILAIAQQENIHVEVDVNGRVWLDEKDMQYVRRLMKAHPSGVDLEAKADRNPGNFISDVDINLNDEMGRPARTAHVESFFIHTLTPAQKAGTEPIRIVDEDGITHEVASFYGGPNNVIEGDKVIIARGVIIEGQERQEFMHFGENAESQSPYSWDVVNRQSILKKRVDGFAIDAKGNLTVAKGGQAGLEMRSLDGSIVERIDNPTGEQWQAVVRKADGTMERQDLNEVQIGGKIMRMEDVAKTKVDFGDGKTRSILTGEAEKEREQMMGELKGRFYTPEKFHLGDVSMGRYESQKREAGLTDAESDHLDEQTMKMVQYMETAIDDPNNPLARAGILDENGNMVKDGLRNIILTYDDTEINPAMVQVQDGGMNVIINMASYQKREQELVGLQTDPDLTLEQKRAAAGSMVLDEYKHHII
ncbi:MAG TPA: hypothetical protein ENN13_03865, partial [Candidatus Altiarchaeales archaeon]|nr:hypothetical protein [Candidatus Altiarchaeales archaeon]